MHNNIDYIKFNSNISDHRRMLNEKGITIHNFDGISFEVFIEKKAMNSKHNLKVVCGKINTGKLEIQGPCNIVGTFSFMGDSSTVVMGGYPEFGLPLRIVCRIFGYKNKFIFSKRSTSNGLTVVTNGSNSVVSVSEDCMIANNVWIRTADMHTVFYVDNLKKSLPHGDVFIDKHVWLGQDCLIMKNVKINSGSIVGAKSLVVSDIPSCCAVGGVPAKILKKNVSWARNFDASVEEMDDVKKQIL